MAESSATTSGNGSDWKLGRNTMNAPITDSASAGIWIGESFSFINTAASSVTKIGESLFNTVTSPCAAWLEAIDAHDTENLCEELGDVLFQVMFHSEIEAEQGNFTVDDVVNGICEKMIRRHPRVFGGEIPEVENEKDLWEAIKKQEREEKKKRAAAH